MKFETDEDLKRERDAIEKFVSLFNGSYKKLSPLDIDFKIFDKNGDAAGYVEVKGRNRTIDTAFPLPISISKLVKLVNKQLNPIVVWACLDGIIYGDVKKIKGEVFYGGRNPRKNSFNDLELIAHYNKQSNIKYVKYTR